MRTYTYSGQVLDLYNLKPSEIELETIAHSLAHQCRFNGHTKEFYSVAQHSILVSEWLPDWLKMAGLLHDAAEAYIGDIITPLKYEHYDIWCKEELVQDVINEVFEVQEEAKEGKEIIKQADKRVFLTEVRDLTDWKHSNLDLAVGKKIAPVGPKEAKRMFLDAYERYCDYKQYLKNVTPKFY